MSSTTADAQVADYMARLRTALQNIWAPRRDQIIADVEDHISAALDEMSDPTPADISSLLERIGDPEQIAAAALNDDPTLAPPPSFAPFVPGQGPGWVAPVTSGLAIASLVLSILWIFAFGSLLAVILGVFALLRIRRSNGRIQGKGLAIAGLIVGAVGLLMPVAWLLILRPAVQNTATASAAAVVNSQQAAAAAAAAQANAAAARAARSGTISGRLACRSDTGSSHARREIALFSANQLIADRKVAFPFKFQFVELAGKYEIKGEHAEPTFVTVRAHTVSRVVLACFGS